MTSPSPNAASPARDTASSPPPATTPQDVLDFWFADGLGLGWPSQDMSARWFKGGPALDAEITARFGALVHAALDGGLSAWEADLHHRLALVILLDQFTRNVFRGQGRAFAGDPRAQQLVRQAIAEGQDATLPVAGRAFLYIPLEHAEDLALQDLCVERFTQLLADAPEALAKPLQGNLDFARQHRDIIARFGRFPHRNQALGRAGTPEEEAFLLRGPRFGQ